MFVLKGGAMHYHPAYCSYCERMWLLVDSVLPPVQPVCLACSHLGRLVPGAYYSESVARVFAPIERSIRSLIVEPGTLEGISKEIDRLLSDKDAVKMSAGFDDMMRRLAVLDAVAGMQNRRTVLLMLRTIVTTFAGRATLPEPVPMTR